MAPANTRASTKANDKATSFIAAESGNKAYGATNGATNGGAEGTKITQIDIKIDNEIVYEFGGPIGVTAMMIIFPFLMYYLWICVEYHEGKLFYPTSFDGVVPFLRDELWGKIVEGASPTLYAAEVFVGFLIYTLVLAYIMPGPTIKGLPVPSLGGRQLDYLCNALMAWYALLVTAFVLNYTGIFPLTDIVDNFGPIMSVAIISGIAITALTYFLTVALGKQHRMSGNFLYDFFMGAPLNPRLGKLDLKMIVEIRVPWVILFFISLSAVLKEYQIRGEVSASLAFMLLAHFLYVNACSKGEECIPTTWDIFYEKWGFMIIFWNFAGVPFTYCMSTFYLLRHLETTGEPITHALPYTIFLFVTLLAAYYVWDTANSQKNYFRMQLRGTYISRNAFPQLPWSTLKNPQIIETNHGSPILVDGWYKYARKAHYAADLVMALLWGLICGTGSVIPYFYVVFFTAVLVHRVTRDQQKMARKYEDAWVEYTRRVPWVFIPYIY